MQEGNSSFFFCTHVVPNASLALDEIPQLINILKGEMSFIGPRPEVLEYVNRFSGLEKYILEVRPGITDYKLLWRVLYADRGEVQERLCHSTC